MHVRPNYQFPITNYPAAAKRAFTLIELLLVLVILAVLAGVVLPRMLGKAKDARIGAAKAQISIIESSLGRFDLDNDRLPTTEEGLEALVAAPPELTEKWKGPYLDKGLPKDPFGKEYVYRNPGQRNAASFDLYSVGPDGVEGTDDDVWSDSK
jgi:general secretion pathway protein G